MLMKLITKNSFMPMPSNISYWWNMGSLLGLCLTSQLITGLILSMFYFNNTDISFDSINHINRNVNMGWLIRSLHANGASMFFIIMYMHIGRNLFYKSFYMLFVWLSGIFNLVLLFMTAFLGYILPWGQMSYWGATVITNLLSSIPYIGNSMTLWVWGGFSVSNPTLTRFFTLHYMTPFIIMAVTLGHIMLLHKYNSSNPLGSPSNIDKIPFHPYFSWKDILGSLFTYSFLLLISLTFPYMLMDPDNFSLANPMVTPPHIQPEWYFLFAYTILRSVPNKLGGVIALLSSIMILTTLPFMSNFKKKINFTNKLIWKTMFFLWLWNWIYLTILGAAPIEYPFFPMSIFNTLFYFMFYLMV